METLKDRDKTSQPKNKPVTEVKYTSKGNRLIEFARVSDEERKKLRIDAYGYLL